MKAFLASVGAAIVIAVVAAAVLNLSDMSSQSVYQSQNKTTRL